MSAKPFCGTLKNAYRMPLPAGGFWVEGRLYEQPFPRFQEGDYIHTSYVVAYDPETKQIETRNSIYRVEWAPGQEYATETPKSIDEKKVVDTARKFILWHSQNPGNDALEAFARDFKEAMAL